MWHDVWIQTSCCKNEDAHVYSFLFIKNKRKEMIQKILEW